MHREQAENIEWLSSAEQLHLAIQLSLFAEFESHGLGWFYWDGKALELDANVIGMAC